MDILAGGMILLDIRFASDKYKELRVTQAVAIDTLASLVEYRDAETSQHLHRMSVVVKKLGDKIQAHSPYSS